MMLNYDLVVVGGGPAGMMAAGTAAMYGAEVTIFESMPFLGKKLAITGKGRCNVTNDSTTQVSRIFIDLFRRDSSEYSFAVANNALEYRKFVG